MKPLLSWLSHRVTALAITLLMAPVLLHGCATGIPSSTAAASSGANALGLAVGVLSGASFIAQTVELASPVKPNEIDQRTFPHERGVVYELLAESAVKECAAQVERDEESHVLRVLYPFSLWRNLWGGRIEFHLTVEHNCTVVSVTGFSHDPVRRVRSISDAILDEVGRRLEKRP